MSQAGYWAIRKWKAGPIGETIKFWVPGKRPDRLTRQARRDVQKAAQNAASAVKVLARLMNMNFRQGDVLLSLDYSQEAYHAMTRDLLPGMEEADRLATIWQLARKNLQNTIRRAQYAARKDGVELRYIATTSDLEEVSTGNYESCRVHHHLIVGEECVQYLVAAWRSGGTNQERLSAQPDYTPVAAYLLRQVRHCEDAKKYVSSRNLLRPEPEDRIAKGGSTIRPPKGAILLDQAAYQPGQPQYIRYILPEAAEDAEETERLGIKTVITVRQHRQLRLTLE